MACTRALAMGVGVLLATACTDDGEATDSTGPTTTSTTSNTTEVTATTIPLPVDTTGEVETLEGSSSAGVDESTTGGSSGSTGPADGSSSSSGEPAESSDDGSPTVYEVEWCRLQYPPAAYVAVSEPFTVYVRLYVPGLTTLSNGNDPAPELVVEMGYSVDGSDPSTGVGAPWTWQAATPNVGWNDAAEPNNDEYQSDLSIAEAGIYDYAARISGDSGRTWVYCDLDDLLTGGYTPDQAGHAEIGQ